VLDEKTSVLFRVDNRGMCETATGAYPCDADGPTLAMPAGEDGER
jgi:hypothetical protein